jgi:hypothetical protein
MNFVAPYMLWGAAAAGIPVAIHFFFRSRYRTVPWAAMKFLLDSIEQTSRRLKFQELVLLIVRCTVLVLLAVALARPLVSGVVASGKEAVDAVFLFDTSFSMGAQEGKQTRLDLAKSAALAVLDHLPAHSTVQVVTCADQATLLGPREPGNLDQARKLIKDLELTHMATDLAPGATEAVSALARGNLPNKELYVFSDMQRLGWEQNGGQLTKTLKDQSARATVYLVRCGKQTPRNVAVVGIAPQSGIPRPGERVGFAVLVRNTGPVAVKNLTVTLGVDEAPKLPDGKTLGRQKPQDQQPIAALIPGETRAVTLTAKLEKTGLRVLTASVKQDDLEADNHFYQVIQVRDQVRVLVVDGGRDEREPARSSAFFLEHALTPVKDELRAKYHVRVSSLTPRRVSGDDLRKYDICVLVNVALERAGKGAEVPPADFVERLGDFVRKGNGLVIFGGENVAAEAYNRILGKQLGLLPLEVRGVASFPADRPIHIDRNSIDAPSLLRFREDEDFKDLSNIEVWRTLDLNEPARADGKEKGKDAGKEKEGSGAVRVVMRYGNGKPALASRKVDAGEVLLVATSADPGWKPKTNEATWNYLAVWPGYVPFVEAALNHLLHRRTQNHNFTAGETLHWHPDPDPGAEARRRAAGDPGAEASDPRSFVLVHPPERPGAAAKRVPLGRPELVQGRPLVTASGLLRAGVYYLTTAERGEGAGRGGARPGETGKAPLEVPFAVVPDLRESVNLESLSDAQLDEQLGFRPVHLSNDGNVNIVSATERTNREWTLWLLAAVLVLVVGEAVLAWFCGRAW